MISYIYKFVFRHGILKVARPKQYLLDLTYNLFLTQSVNKSQILTLELFLYSLGNFINWAKLIHCKQLHTWFILDEKDLIFLQRILKTFGFSWICEQSWIPGIVSNNKLVYKGKRFLHASSHNELKIHAPLDVAFFCVTKNPVIIKEMHDHVIPSIVSLANITASNFNYFVPLFLPENKPLKSKFCKKDSKTLVSNYVSQRSKYRDWLYYLMFLIAQKGNERFR